MTKGTAILVGLGLAVLPAVAAAQQVGAVFTIADRPDQPEIQASAASVPAGWAYSVSHGSEGGDTETQVARSRRTEVAMPVSTGVSAPGRETVTWTFVPL